MFKLDIDPLAPRLLLNREAHIDYLKYTQEQVDILRVGDPRQSLGNDCVDTIKGCDGSTTSLDDKLAWEELIDLTSLSFDKLELVELITYPVLSKGVCRIIQRLEAFVASPIGCGGSDIGIA
ncbi:hypothetical protein Tco_0385997 [Tanacetum coccineum]